MRVALELPEDRVAAVKAAAKRRGCALPKIVETALRRELAACPPVRPKPKHRSFRWTTFPGRPTPGLNVANREAMYKWFDRHPDRG